MPISTKTHYPRRLVNGRIALVNEANGKVEGFLNPDDAFPCGWQYLDGVTEDGEPYISECGCAAWGDVRGWRCTNGHGHVSMEARHAEGWDYYDDDEMAAAERGDFLPMGGMVPMAQPDYNTPSVG